MKYIQELVELRKKDRNEDLCHLRDGIAGEISPK
jgi:hypothetical protein